MDDRKISITIWGKEKGNWIEWYHDIKNLMNKLGYEHTHIGILSKNYSSGKILTVALFFAIVKSIKVQPIYVEPLAT